MSHGCDVVTTSALSTRRANNFCLICFLHHVTAPHAPLWDAATVTSWPFWKELTNCSGMGTSMGSWTQDGVKGIAASVGMPQGP